MREARGARDRRAAEGRPVIAGLQAASRLFVDQHRAYRQPVRERLRNSDDVGPHAERLEREERPETAHPALDLVEDQKRAAFVAQAPRFRPELGIRRMDATLALNRLDDEGGDPPI